MAEAGIHWDGTLLTSRGEGRAWRPSRATHRERRESAMVQSYSMNATP